ncbi:MAG: PHB depolymerase family esterase, partial [Anaerolineales bacterium]
MNRKIKIYLSPFILASSIVACLPTAEIPPTITAHPKSTQVTATITPHPTTTLSQTAMASPVQSYRYSAPGDYIATIQVGDSERWFAIHIPLEYHPGVLTPLVVNIHGRGSTAIIQDQRSWMSKKADEEGFIAVHPQALGQPSTWWGAIPNARGQQDMDFFEMMMTYLEGELSIDPKRVYVTGISNGGSMANRLACEMSELIAAVAPVSAGHAAFHQCQIESPI